MVTLNPYFLTVEFKDGSPEVKKTYSGGASQAIDAVVKAVAYYKEKNIPCTIILRDHRGCRIVTRGLG